MKHLKEKPYLLYSLAGCSVAILALIYIIFRQRGKDSLFTTHAWYFLVITLLCFNLFCIGD